MPTKTKGAYRPRARIYYLAFAREFLVVENDRVRVRKGLIKKPATLVVGYLIKHAGTFIGYV